MNAIEHVYELLYKFDQDSHAIECMGIFKELGIDFTVAEMFSDFYILVIGTLDEVDEVRHIVSTKRFSAVEMVVKKGDNDE